MSKQKTKAISAKYNRDELLAEVRTKSAAIRQLTAEGYTRTEIAAFLEIRYQHVRNVLVNDAEKAERITLRAELEALNEA